MSLFLVKKLQPFKQTDQYDHYQSSRRSSNFDTKFVTLAYDTTSVSFNEDIVVLEFHRRLSKSPTVQPPKIYLRILNPSLSILLSLSYLYCILNLASEQR